MSVARPNPRVTVVVPTHQPRHLEQTLAGLARQRERDFEVVVVENGRRSARVARAVGGVADALPVRHVHVSLAGLNRARNAGVKLSRGAIVALIDDDCIPEPGWLGAISAAHARDPGAGVIGGQVRLRFLERRPGWLVGPFRHLLSEVDWGRRRRELDASHWVAGANFSFTRDMYLRVGRFREDLGLVGRTPPQLCHDETEFIARARGLGSPGLVYTPEAVVRHLIPESRTTLDYMAHRHYGQGVSDIAMLGEDPQRAAELLADSLCSPDWLWLLRHWTRRTPLRERRRFRRIYLHCRLAYLQGLAHALTGGFAGSSRTPRRVRGGRDRPDNAAATGGFTAGRGRSDCAAVIAELGALAADGGLRCRYTACPARALAAVDRLCALYGGGGQAAARAAG